MTEKVSVLPVIMAGGSGSRLWPLSRAGFPKQFLILSGDSSLFQQAAQRINGLDSPEFRVQAPLVVGNSEHRFLALEQLHEIQVEPGSIVLEPMGRNTAPAVTLAALYALEQGADPVMVVTPADQTVADLAVFTTALQQAVRVAAHGSPPASGSSAA